MDWHSITFDWNRARAFLVTAEEGSLSAAARALGMAQPTLGRQVSALEDELGVTLFQRTPRGQELTEAGLSLLAHVRAMAEAAQQVALTATGQAEAVEGNVCITASEIYATHLLPPVIAKLRRDHPGITLEIVASNAVSDLRRREADIAVRNVRPEQPDLVARKLRDDQGTFYATPAYLAAFGPPKSSADLANATFIGFAENRPLLEGLQAMGFPVTEQSFPVTSASHVTQWALVTEGIGIGVAPTSLGDADPRVVRALPDLPPITYPIWLTAHREVKTSRRMRLVFDALADALSRPVTAG